MYVHPILEHLNIVNINTFEWGRNRDSHAVIAGDFNTLFLTMDKLSMHKINNTEFEQHVKQHRPNRLNIKYSIQQQQNAHSSQVLKAHSPG